MADVTAGTREAGIPVSPRHDVFISYSHKNKLQADAVCALLERDGLRCWIAPRDAAAGAEWATSIIRAIHTARAFVLIFSEPSNTSKQVRQEVSAAFSRELPIIPFRIENVTPSEQLEYFLASQHWLDAMDPPLEAHIQGLSSSLRNLLALERKDPGPGTQGSEPQAADGAAPAVAALENQIRQMQISASYGSIGKKVLGTIVGLVAVWLLIHVPSALASGPQNAAGVGILTIGCFSIAGLLWR
jgi:hypothetical protein